MVLEGHGFSGCPPGRALQGLDVRFPLDIFCGVAGARIQDSITVFCSGVIAEACAESHLRLRWSTLGPTAGS